jgi:putative FmdB family regulatory protein
MPRYDYVCGQGHEQRDVWAKYGDRPACPECGGAVEILWQKSFPNIIGDEIDYVDHNIASEPIRFTSKSERKRMMKEKGLIERVQHREFDHGDKSPHTSRWV